MPAKKKKPTAQAMARKERVAKLHVNGMTLPKIAKLEGVSRQTTLRDWREMEDSESVRKHKEEMVKISSAIAMNGSIIMEKYLRDQVGKQLRHYEATTVNAVIKDAQDRASKLSGDLVNEDGGDKNPLVDLMQKFQQGKNVLDD